MYRAKADGGDSFRFYRRRHEPAARAMQRRSIADLRRALARGEFVLHYQPQVELAHRPHRRRRGADPLAARERRARRPGDFLPRAEENGLIVPINEWVLREACRQAASWRAQGLPPLRIASTSRRVQFRKADVGSS